MLSGYIAVFVCRFRHRKFHLSTCGQLVHKFFLDTGSWFILRTHGEEIEEIEGGSWEKIEEDAYLICVENAEVKMQMKTPGLHYYTGKN